MGLLDSNSKAVLVESMRSAIIDSVVENSTLTESVQMEGVKFVQEDATYEQLLNMTMNPLRESKYLPAHVLEGAVAILSEAMLTGREIIGINAITEGALNLVKKTDCVVTESMLDAAVEAAKGNGLNVVAEAIVMTEDAISKMEKKLGRKLTQGELYKAVSSKYGTTGEKTREKVFERSKKIEGGIQKMREKMQTLKDELKAAYKTKNSNKIKKAKEALEKAQSELNRRVTSAGKSVTKNGKIVADKNLSQKAANFLSKNKGKLGLAAAGLAATGAGLYGIKKWHDKKQAEKTAASKRA